MLTSKELYEKIDALRVQRGLKVSELNTLAGISAGTLPSWKQRGTMPKLEILESLCFALGVSLAEVIYDVNADKLTGEEIEHLSDFRKLNGKQKVAVRQIIKTMIEE